jgi:hypothetical protein
MRASTAEKGRELPMLEAWGPLRKREKRRDNISSRSLVQMRDARKANQGVSCDHRNIFSEHLLLMPAPLCNHSYGGVEHGSVKVMVSFTSPRRGGSRPRLKTTPNRLSTLASLLCARKCVVILFSFLLFSFPLSGFSLFYKICFSCFPLWIQYVAD